MAEKNRTCLSSKNVLSNIFSKSVISMAIGGIVTFLGNIIDGLVIGRELGTIYMSAYQLAMPVITILAMIPEGMEWRIVTYTGDPQNKMTDQICRDRITLMPRSTMLLIGSR